MNIQLIAAAANDQCSLPSLIPAIISVIGTLLGTVVGYLLSRKGQKEAYRRETNMLRISKLYGPLESLIQRHEITMRGSFSILSRQEQDEFYELVRDNITYASDDLRHKMNKFIHVYDDFYRIKSSEEAPEVDDAYNQLTSAFIRENKALRAECFFPNRDENKPIF